LLPALFEETAHRGLLIKGLSPLGVVKALILSSILFGLMHLNINQFFYATVLGFLIGLTVIISKNIIPGIVIHFVNNFVSIYFAFASHNRWFGADFTRYFQNFLTDGTILTFFLKSILMISIIMFVIVILFIILLRETRIKKVSKMLTEISEINKEYKTTPQVFTDDSNFMNIKNIKKLMSQYNIKNLNSMIFTELESKTRKLYPKEKILMASTFLLGGLVTVFTFIWGIL